jgi:hypothetical protein
MNPFAPGDRVQCKQKNRRNGQVIEVFCGDCGKCKDRFYKDCTQEPLNRVKVIVSFPVEQGQKRYRYDYSELSFEDPIPFKSAERSYDLSPRDIRPLGSAKVDVPLIVPDTDEGEPEMEVEEPTSTIDLNIHKPSYGMLLDDYLAGGQRMRRPI